MHELSIARDLIDLAAEEAARAGASRVVRVKLRIGALAGIVPAALRSAFEAAKGGTTLAEALLEIEPVAAAIYCDGCAAEHVLPSVQRRRCPACGSAATVATAGDELELVEIEAG